MIEYQFYPQVFTAFLQESKTSTENPIALERSYYGWDHADISARLCEAWKINPDFIIPIRHHHTPWDAPESYRFSACLIDVANQIVKKSGFGFVNPMPYSLQAPVLDLLQLQPIDLEVLQEDFEKEIQEVFQFFNQL
jgi:HD-like signal output (HDOD) protein